MRLLTGRPNACHLLYAHAPQVDGEHTGLPQAGQGDADGVASCGREDGARGAYADRSCRGGRREPAQRRQTAPASPRA